MKTLNLNTLTKIALLSALSFIFMLVLEFPLPFMPPWLKMDFSDLPVIIGGFALGPVPAICIALVKNILHCLIKLGDGMYIGQFANFVLAVSLAIPASYIYRKNPSKKSAFAGMIIGSIIMTLVGVVLNLFVLLPIYSRILMPMEALISFAGTVNPAINSLATLIIIGVVPFNIIKCIILILIIMLLYKQINLIIKRAM